MKGAKDPFPNAKSPFYCVVEVAEAGAAPIARGGGGGGGGGAGIAAGAGAKSSALRRSKRRLGRFARALRDSGLATSYAIGTDEKHASKLWKLRERIPLALKRNGAVYKYDLSLPTETTYDVVDALRDRIAKKVTNPDDADGSGFDFSSVAVMGYGHLGDGNLHLNVSSPRGYHASLEKTLEPFVYEWTEAVKGSVSAEHGVGVMKPKALSYSKSAEAMATMRLVKKTLDPNGILNPYKVFPGGDASKDENAARTNATRSFSRRILAAKL